MAVRAVRRQLVLIAVAALIAVVLPAAPPAQAAPATSRVSWSTCYREVTAQTGVGYQCATVGVPLDYDRPNGPAVQIALVRLPATGPGARVGSLFVNPGGPGGSGVDFALFFGPFASIFLGDEVRQRFDIIGFDPRGVGRSTAIRCFGNERQAAQVFPPVPFPMTEQEIDLVRAANGLLADQCDQRGNKIADHMSTANVARDLDLLRAAVGDRQLSFLGLSYGTFLGVTYANMFPDRVRAVVVDGVLDPEAWSNTEAVVPFSTQLRSDQGAQATLERFFELCDAAGDACAFGPGSAARYADLADRLLSGPVMVQDPETGETFPIRYQDLIAFTLGALYDSFAFPFLAEFLADVEAGAGPAVLGGGLAQLERVTGLVNKRGFPHYVNVAESFPAVACEDSRNPTDYEIWRTEGESADANFGYFGRLWTWASSPCAQWPLSDDDAYRGPYNLTTANPVLVIGNLYDPATRYQGAQKVRSLLPNSALLTVDVAGHTSLGLSLCAGQITGQYLLNPATATAVDGTTCPQEFDPFLLGPPTPTGAEMSRVRAHLLPIIAYRPTR